MPLRRNPGDGLPPLDGPRVRFESVADDRADRVFWSDVDLGSLMELCFAERQPFRAMSDDERSACRARLAPDRRSGADPGAALSHASAYWLVVGGERIGTVAVAGWNSTYEVTGLYVRPDARAQGFAREVLDQLQASSARDGGVGLSLSTEWTWPGLAAWYLKLGFRIRHWKRALTFERLHDMPQIVVTVEGTNAQCHSDGVLVYRASAEGTRLVLTGVWRDPNVLPTFALHLALAGLPLVRSREQWSAARGYDVGGPELLARKIRHWEALARAHGEQGAGPRIPGLTYSSLAELDDPPVSAALFERLRDQLGSSASPGPSARSFAVTRSDGTTAVVGIGWGELGWAIDKIEPSVTEVIEISPGDVGATRLQRRGDAWGRDSIEAAGVIAIGGRELRLDELYAGLEIDPC